MQVQPDLFDSAKLFLLRSAVLRLCGHLHCRFTVTTLDQPICCLQTKAHIHFLIAHRSNKHVDRFLGILPNVVAKFKRRGIRETSFATSSRTSTPIQPALQVQDPGAVVRQDGRTQVTMMVQIPDSFDPTNSCIVAAPSSGSRGVYGAIATAGEWGLKHGCAVAYTDKGTGNGAHDLQNNTVNLIQGDRADAALAGDDSNFTAQLSDSQRATFNAATPNRFAFKHAHSQLNPEKEWGKNVLRSIKFAFKVLYEKLGLRGVQITKQNTIVIASSVSNGGGASARAVEQDEDHLIDGLAVGEPNVNPKFSSKFTIVQGEGTPF